MSITHAASGAALTGLSPCVVPKLYRVVLHTHTHTSTVMHAHNPSPTTTHTAHHTQTLHEEARCCKGTQHVLTALVCFCFFLISGALAGVDPSKILQVDMNRIEWTTSSEGKKIPKFPKGMVLHREAVWWGDKGIHPGDGLAIFLQKFRDNFVVLRFIDAVHAKMGLVSVDFPEECFDAWKQTELRKDCFLEPPAVQVLTSKPYAWNR